MYTHRHTLLSDMYAHSCFASWQKYRIQPTTRSRQRQQLMRQIWPKQFPARRNEEDAVYHICMRTPMLGWILILSLSLSLSLILSLSLSHICASAQSGLVVGLQCVCQRCDAMWHALIWRFVDPRAYVRSVVCRMYALARVSVCVCVFCMRMCVCVCNTVSESVCNVWNYNV